MGVRQILLFKYDAKISMRGCNFEYKSSAKLFDPQEPGCIPGPGWRTYLRSDSTGSVLSHPGFVLAAGCTSVIWRISTSVWCVFDPLWRTCLRSLHSTLTTRARQVANELIELAWREEGENVKDERLNGKKYDLPEPPDGEVWTREDFVLPEEGELQVDRTCSCISC